MAEKVLLIIDDEVSVCRALSRTLRPFATRVITVQTVTDALLVLETQPVTHVLCDHLLSPGEPKGLDVARAWKQQFASLVRVVVLTGASIRIDVVPDGIDAVIPKVAHPDKIRESLEL